MQTIKKAVIQVSRFSYTKKNVFGNGLEFLIALMKLKTHENELQILNESSYFYNSRHFTVLIVNW